MSKQSLFFAAVLIGLLALAGFSPVQAKDVGIGIRAGTHGAGAEVGVGITKWFSIRGGYYAASVSDDIDEGGIEYDATLEVGGLGVLADFFPFKGSFRVTAGVFSNDNNLEVEAIPTEDQEIGGTVYTPAEVGELFGGIEFDDTAPYAGIGWGRIDNGKRVGFLFDVGVLAQGSGQVTLETTGGVVSGIDLALEAAEVEDDISEYDFWPVIAVGLAIRF